VIGTNIDPTTGEIPSDDAIQISFDRYLLPTTAIRQSYAIADNTNKVLPAEGFQTVYDPVARTITIAGPQGPGVPWLTEGLEYKLVLFVPPNNETDVAGFRAIDRAPLDQNQKLTFVFKAGKAKGGPVRPVDPPVNFCADVLPMLTVKCGDATCHGSPPTPTGGTQPAASLLLSTSSGVRVTALRRVAQGSNTGGRSFDPEPAGPVFGIDMALINPGNPGESWLMYKIEMAPPPVIDAGAAPRALCTPSVGSDAVTTPGAPYTSRAPIVPAASDAERERLADYILGRWMPYPSAALDYSTQPLTFEERERVRRWIAQGAPTPECGGCGVDTSPTTDAGAPATDAGP
jgi:hypothetical protein